MPLLSVRILTKRFDGLMALNNFSLDVEEVFDVFSEYGGCKRTEGFTVLNLKIKFRLHFRIACIAEN